MPSLPFFQRRFTPSWQMTLLAAFFILLFLRLGFWQISRAHEKDLMMSRYVVQQKRLASDWQAGMAMPAQYQKIVINGRYLAPVFFLDNQHHKHQFGYHVISPLQLDGGDIVMVDRGWVKGDLNRQILPKITKPLNRIGVKGNVYYPHIARWTLGPMIEQRDKNITIIEQINSKKLSQILQKKVYPFIIRLDKQQAHGFVRDWAVISMPPQRHLAYALQWFAMALVILILFIALNLKKKI